jgi:DnaJ-class molecular chaperone
VAAVTPSASSGDHAADPGECLACRGTGRVISGLGGTPHDVVCPWCEGTGRRVAGIDAQAHPAEQRDRPPAHSGASGGTPGA